MLLFCASAIEPSGRHPTLNKFICLPSISYPLLLCCAAVLQFAPWTSCQALAWWVTWQLP
jgi:hypothetical protein